MVLMLLEAKENPNLVLFITIFLKSAPKNKLNQHLFCMAFLDAQISSSFSHAKAL